VHRPDDRTYGDRVGDAARRWAELQGGRGIPPEILAAARVDPWTHEPRDFTAPDVAVATASRHAATVLLGDGGTVLDVGCGGGAAAFALDGITAVTGVDRQRDMLELLAAAATARGVPHRIVSGTWPDVAGAAGAADVVLCHHVLHNVVDLPPFLRALTAAARRGVVVEMFAEHPLAWLDPLWLRFHNLRRPPPATVDDAVAVLGELGIRPEVARWDRATVPRGDAAWVARRLCLPPERTEDVAAALADLPTRPRQVATLTWRS
jgi:SAM-dependent methyltransferase